MEVSEAKFTPPDDLTTRIRLSFAARNLLDRDVFSKSDPMCVVFLSTGFLHGDSYREHGRTEVIRNCLNPEWNERIEVDYFFEEVQRIKFEIYDIDSSSSELSEHDFLGKVETTLAEIVGAPSCERTFALSGVRRRKAHGELIVYAEEAENVEKEKVQFVCKGAKLDKKDLFGKSDPFLQIYRTNGNSSMQLAYRTEFIKRTLNPEWKPFEISTQQLCGKDMDRPIRIECFDYNRGGSHDYIGSCETTLRRLLHKKDEDLPLINEKKQKKKGTKYGDSGRLVFSSVTTYRDHSFVEYIAGGTQLDFFVAIDMTASNGLVADPNSLHFIGLEQPNEYHIAISAVAEICQHYNNTKIFLAAGFGAKLPYQSGVDHCFPLDLSTGSYFVHGVQGLLQAYRCCLMTCTLSGPTNFAPVINEAAKRAALHPRNGSRYQILLIITDGCITDYFQTMNAIIAASYLPLSIIIVGVGGEDFQKMHMLDSDNELLQYQGRTAQRDIVQFVSLREFLGEKGIVSPANQSVSAMAHLAKEVLAEVPHQLTSYMKVNGIKPRPADDPFPVEQPPMMTSAYAVGRKLSVAAASQPGKGHVTSAPATPSFRPHPQRQSLPLATRMPSYSDVFTSLAGGFYPSLHHFTAPACAAVPPVHSQPVCNVQSVQSAPYPTSYQGPPPYYSAPSMSLGLAQAASHLQYELYEMSSLDDSSSTKPPLEPNAPPGPQ